MTDLFGGLPTYTTIGGETVEVKKRGKHFVQPRGGADRPGTGPKGETCGSCQHIRRSERFAKCALTRAAWTHSPRTDIRVRWVACSKWERKAP
jgi:hypothetical protein